MPPTMHLVIISREDPALPLPLLRGRRQLNEIGLTDLKLSAAETAYFLNGLMRLNLAADDVARLEARTEGWVTGLHLAALSLERLDPAARQHLVRAWSGESRAVLDYLLAEVLAQQPAEVVEFLLKSSILDRFCAPLCEAVVFAVDAGEGEGARSILERIERANLFLIPLDQHRGWFRFHHLWADLLRHQLQIRHAPEIPSLQRRASRWFEEHGHLPQGFEHALRVEDDEYLVDFMRRQAGRLLCDGEIETLVSWLDRLGEHHFVKWPWLYLFYAWGAGTLLQMPKGEAALRRLDQYLSMATLPESELTAWQGRRAAVAGFLATRTADVARIQHESLKALDHLPPENELLRGLAHSNLAIAHWYSGDLAETITAVKHALPLNQRAGNVTEVLILYSTLAQAHHERGELKRVEEVCHEALAAVGGHNPDITRQIPVGLIALQLGQLYYEWNRLEEATEIVRQGIETGQPPTVSVRLMSRVLLATILGARGDEAAALHELSRIRELTGQMALPQIVEAAFDIEAFIHLKRGDMTAVNRWIDALRIGPDDQLTHFREPRYLNYAHTLIEQGDVARATQLLDRIIDLTERGGRIERQVRALTLKSLALAKAGRFEDGVAVLKRAILLAEPGRFVRTFLSVDRLIPHLLAQIEPDHERQARYIADLLQQFSTEPLRSEHLSAEPVGRDLPDPLTARELEILRLVAAGKSNREIAAELYLALGTVKKHISNIFGKLQVTNRTGATARARELGLL